ncbi:hypothetical protein JTB14_034254 [Gonioctena quinquepunctata]|nr:hypothetical protein JTB14_034254 [Gonioctena quinquepunctata]
MQSLFVRKPNPAVHEPRLRSGTWEEPTCEHRVAPPLTHTRTLQHTISQRSSEDSWCSGSEPDLSSDEESDRSAASSNSSNEKVNPLRFIQAFGNIIVVLYQILDENTQKCTFIK